MSIPVKSQTDLLNRYLTRELEHGIRVSRLCRLIGKAMGLPSQSCYDLSLAGFLHDVGKLKISFLPDSRREQLTIEELRYERMHAAFGADYLKSCGYPDYIVSWVRYHHENCDGSGYPDHLRRGKIPLGSKIIRVSDEFISLTSERRCRKAFTQNEAVDMMIAESEYYDLEVFLKFLQIAHTSDLSKLVSESYKLTQERKGDLIHMFTSPEAERERKENTDG